MLQALLSHGNVNTVNAVPGTIPASSLSNTAKVELISGRNGQGTPALYAAYRTGQNEVVSIINEPILTCSLSNKDKVTLMKAEDSSKTSSLHAALSKYHAVIAAVAFCQIMQNDFVKA